MKKTTVYSKKGVINSDKFKTCVCNWAEERIRIREAEDGPRT